MKKLFSVLLTVALVLTSISVVTFANTAAPTITVGNEQGKVGTPIDVYVTLANAPAISYFMVDDLTYDKEALELTASEVVAQNPKVSDFTDGVATFAYAENTDCNGQVLKMTFTATKLGEYPITFEYHVIKNKVDSKETKIDGTTVVPGSITVVADPFPDTLTLANDTVTYDGQTHELAIAGNEGDFADVDVEYSYKKGAETLASLPVDAGTYDVTAHIEKAGYTPKDLTATLTIEQRPVEITGLTATNRAYDGTTDVVLSGGTLEGKVADDDVTAVMPVAGTIENANAGDDKAVSFAEITLSGAKAANYVLTQPTVTVDITKVAIAVKADDVVAVIGESIDSVMAKLGLSLTSGALVGTDTLDANPETGIFASAALDALEFTSTAAEGTYTITKNAEFALTETAAKNYDMTFADGTLTVQNKLAVNVTVSMEGWTYGGDASALTYEQTDAGNGTVADAPSILFTVTL